jgi:translation initiation factor 2 subunit 2
MEEYEKLLKLAIEKVPKKVFARDRFVIPEPKVETQKNKTIIKNMKEIADVLRRPAEHLAKYLMKELATPGSLEGETLVLQTSVTAEMVKKKIENYTKEFVYCKVCGKPDTKLVKEDRISFIVCEACGAKSSVGKK